MVTVSMKEWFQSRSIRQEEVADVLGVSASSVSRYYSGKQSLSASKMEKLHRHFGMPYEVVSGGFAVTDEMRRQELAV